MNQLITETISTLMKIIIDRDIMLPIPPNCIDTNDLNAPDFFLYLKKN